MLYTIIIYTENKPGVLYRIADLFLRRRINIESLTVSEIEERAMSRFTITVHAEGSLVEKIVKQIYRIIEVLKVIETTNEGLIYQEVALYRVSASSSDKRARINEIVKLADARIHSFNKSDITLSKVGTEEETESLKMLLSPLGIKEFVRSGRVAIPKSEEKLSGKFSLQMNK
jgi:acetolactate synthase-1/3 small subunit